jgi:hypothetical protein
VRRSSSRIQAQREKDLDFPRPARDGRLMYPMKHPNI